jgi:fido (protein-threonine AMPylation protein)
MPDWDSDSEKLQRNLERVLSRIRHAARRHEQPTVEAARGWHTDMMEGLQAPDPDFVGRFRGEAGIENVEVSIGPHSGVPAGEVAGALTKFQTTLQQAVDILDRVLPPGSEPDADVIAAILDLCGWAHAEWARIHPIANGNGRTARLWANGLAMRYGLPPFVRLRPRPDGGYAAAGARAMAGEWEPTAAVFLRMYLDFLAEYRSGD